ncbi:LOG family protein [Flavitalea antarctica]
MNIDAVAVFCGSKNGVNPIYSQHAAELGKLIAVLNLKLVYGGGKKGLMGIIADSVLENGGRATGVIPKVLIEWEQQHDGLSELTVVPDMHTRKKMMYELCDVAIVMPGGFGTMDELFEMLTWNQLKIHDKKIYILNSDGYYNHLMHHLHHARREGFLYELPEERIIFCNSPIEIFNRIE